MATSQPANNRQVGGQHYKLNAVKCPHCGGELQHWDIYRFFPYLVGTITKYLWRWRDKNGVQDLDKARHYLDKLIETEGPEVEKELDSQVYSVRETELCSCPFPVPIDTVCGKCGKKLRPRNTRYDDIGKGSAMADGPT
jgi:hypothetical protein